LARLTPHEGFAARIQRACEAFALSWSDSERAARVTAFARYAELVAVWNERVDLTAARSADELVDLLFADALAICSAVAIAADETWCDVGSGVGAPGIPLALAAPMRMRLIEPRDKRVAFLRTALGTLDRADVAVERCRSERLAAQSVDVAVSRATLPPAEWLSEGSRLATRGVWILLAKGELPEAAVSRVVSDVRYRWPLTGVERRAVYVAPVRAATA
jgi:16S rRNA (guanine527-N7)-methyltransferase